MRSSGLISALCVGAALVSAPKDAQATPMIEKVVSPGGIEAWLISDQSVPVVAVDFLFAGGTALDPEGKEGLAVLVSSLLNEGAGDYDSQAFLGRLADLSITLNFSVDEDSFGGTLKTLATHGEEAFDLLGLSVSQPRFDDEAVARMRAELDAGLQQSARNPSSIASRAWRRAAFANHPYARPREGTREGLAAVTKDDLRAFVARRLTRESLIISVCGDITAKALAPLLDRAFGDLPMQGEDMLEVPPTKVAASGITVIEQDTPQSLVLFGHEGPLRSDSDYFAARLVNHVLGGSSLTSRLGDEIREKRGLVYSIYTYLNPRRQAGVVAGGLATANASAATALNVLRQEWQKIAAKGISAQELADAKTYMTGAFPLSMTTTSGIAALLTAIQYHDLGIDYLQRRDDLINSVTLEQANRVAARMFDSERLLVTIVGRPEGIESTRPN